MKCPNCGSDNDSDAVECSMCNLVLKKPETAAPAAAAQPAQEPSTPPKIPAAEEISLPVADQDWECTACATINLAGTPACSMCNLVFSAAASVRRDPEPSPPQKTPRQSPRPPRAQPKPAPKPVPAPVGKTARPALKIECPACGQLNAAGRTACELCDFALPKPPAPAPEAPPKFVSKSSPTARTKPPEPIDDEPSWQARPLGQPFEGAATPPPGLGKKSADAVVCPNCKSVNPPGTLACGMCYFNFQAPPAAVPELEPDLPLPAEKPAPGGGADNKPARGNSAPNEDGPKKSKRARRSFVLIVEDDKNQAELLNEFLESKGVNWRTDCVDAKQALIQAEALNVGLVLMDLMLPGYGNGAESYKSLRKSPHLTPQLPIIFMTGLPPEKARSMLPLEDPCVRLLHKPLDLALLEATIKELTGKQFIQ